MSHDSTANLRTSLHQDDGLAATRVPRETLADLELRVIRKFLITPGRVLDVGCGHARTCQYLRLEGFDTVGVELDPNTLREANQGKSVVDLAQLALCDGRELCFRNGSFDYVVSFASTLSEKYRLWMCRGDRLAFIREAMRVTRPGGLVIVNFVHRYWNFVGFLKFLRNYWMWMREKVFWKRTELGDYVEKIGGTKIRFHAFTILEARSLFPRYGVKLETWKRGRGPFTDWLFIVAKKTDSLRKA